MEAKDTLIKNPYCPYPFDGIDESLNMITGEYLQGAEIRLLERGFNEGSEAQAGISFNAGQKEAYDFGWRTGKRAGIKEVVDWADEYCTHRQGKSGIQNMAKRYCEDCWQVQLKVWKIK